MRAGGAICDVLVAGGGVAGVAAAVTSARAGARTILVERSAGLGGAGVRGLLRYVCGLYPGGGGATPSGTLNGGFAREVERALARLSRESRMTRMGKVYVLPCSSGNLRRVLGAACAAARMLEVRTGWSVTAVRADEGLIRRALIRRGGAREVLHPRVVVDATGDGSVSAKAGAKRVPPRSDDQLAGFTIRLAGLRSRDEMLPVRVPHHMRFAPAVARLPSSFRFTTYVAGAARGEGFLKFSVVPSARLTDAAVRRLARRAVRFLQGRIDALRGCRIREDSGVLPRGGGRIRGRMILTANHVLGARKFPGGGVRNAWPIELWDRRKGAIFRYLEPGEFYEIPLSCQRVRGTRNLFTAGRCISASREALGSARVMGPCLSLGEQAGCAAAALARAGGGR